MMVHSGPMTHNSHHPTGTIDPSVMAAPLQFNHQRPNNSNNNNHVSKNAIPESSHSMMATAAIDQGNYRKAFDYYRLALNEYLDGSPTVVELVNAAATCFNLGALSKKLQSHQQAADYFLRAEELYKSCSKKVQQAPINDVTDGSCDVCLFQLIVETIHARAHLHYKYQRRLDEAIECHEEVVEVLDQQQEQDRTVVYFKIRFTRLPKESRDHLLMTSLQSLGKFYVERGDFEDGLVAYQEALAVLQEQSSSSPSTKQRQDELTQIIRVLSDIYMKKQSSTMEVPQLERLARLQESLKHWGKAMSCWERVLYLQSQQHGEESVPVADALCQIARVMTIQGNREGALDLYHAAMTKYHYTKTPLPREAVGNITNIYCQLQLQDDALEYLDELILHVQNRHEEAWILCQRGRIYLEQGHLYEAGQDLRESAAMLGSQDAYVHKLLQKLETLQKRAESSRHAISATQLDMPLECILECDENSTVTQEQTEEIIAGQQLSKLTLDSSSHLAKRMTVRVLETLDEQRQEGCVTPDVDVLACADETVLKSDDKPGDNSEACIPSFVPDDLVTSSVCENQAHDGTSTELAIHQSPTLGSQSSPPRLKKTDDINNYHDGMKSTEDFDESTMAVISPMSDRSALSDKISVDPTDVSTSKREDVSADDKSPVKTFDDASSVDEESNLSDNISQILESSLQQSEGTTSQGQQVEATKPKSGLTVSVDPSPRGETGDEILRDLPPIDASDYAKKSRTVASPLPSKNASYHEREEIVSKSPRSSDHSSRTWQRNPDGVDRRDASPGKAASRSRFVKALANPFRRTRSKKQLLANGLEALDEEKEVRNFPAAAAVGDQMDCGETFDGAPVSIIAARMRGDDDDHSEVSQITFHWEEQATQKSSQDNQWWWGVTAEGLEGWFPTAYVHQAVEAAEGFLSAKSIHELVKTRPLDFDSEDESESEHDAGSDARPKSAKSNSASNETGQPGGPANSDDSDKKFNSDSSVKGSEPQSNENSARSSPSKRTALTNQIKQKEARLEKPSTSDDDQPTSRATVLLELAVLRTKNGEIGQALGALQQALKIYQSTNNIADAAKTLQLMAELHSRAKQYKAALLCYSEAQKYQESMNGYYHEEIANLLNRQGNVLARQGQFDQAMENHREALRILKECCGEEVKNPLVSQTLIQIGAVYYKERNSLQTIQKNRDGYGTFIESGMLEVIGRAHEDRGSYRMAIAFFEEKLHCLDDSENSKELEQVAETLNSLGMLSCRAGMYLEAIDYYDRALAIQMKLGCDDVQLAMARVLAGSVQYSLGHFKKALKLFEDALRTLRDNIGKEQETVAATLFHMGVVRVALYDYDEAMSNLKDALKTQKKLLGAEHPATLRTRREIGQLRALMDPKFDAHLDEFNDILEIQKRIHGERHPNVAETLHVIGCAQVRKGDQALGLQTLESCYNMRLEFLGMDHPLQATTLHEIAKIRLAEGRVKKAMRICDSALLIRKESLSEYHIDVATVMATKASCLVARGSFIEASVVFLEAYTIAKQAVGDRHPAIAEIQVQIGSMHLRKCHFDEAAAAINKALDIYRAYGLNDANLGVKNAMKELERVERAEMLCV